MMGFYFGSLVGSDSGGIFQPVLISGAQDRVRLGAWCSDHNGSLTAGLMFEDPGFLRFNSGKLSWSLEQQSSWPV